MPKNPKSTEKNTPQNTPKATRKAQMSEIGREIDRVRREIEKTTAKPPVCRSYLSRLESDLVALFQRYSALLSTPRGIERS